MTDDFERDLAAALGRAAARAPLDAPEWIEPAVSPAAPTSTTRVLGAAAVVAALVGGTTALVVTRVDDPAVRTVASTPAPPPEGTEVPLEVLRVTDELRRLIYPQAIKPGSVAAVQVDGAQIVAYTPATWPGVVGEPVQEQRCIELRTGIDDGFGRCWSDRLHRTGPIRAGGWIAWALVPDDVAYVSIELDDEVFWQRPRAGLITIPDRPHDDLRVSAVNHEGHATKMLEHHPPRPEVRYQPEPIQPVETYPEDVTDEIGVGVVRAVDEAVSQCLDDAGLGDPLAPIPAGVDVDAEWEGCLAEAQAVVDGELASSTEPPPEGTEVALDPLPLSPTDWFGVVRDPGPVRPGSVVGVQVDGTTVVAYASLGRGGAAIAESRCAGFDGTTGCTLAREPVTVSGLSNSRQSLMFVWVPDDVEFVAFEFDEVRYWQRPIDGFAAVPNQQYEQLRVVGIGADGDETILFEDPPAVLPAPAVSDPPPERVPVTAEVEEMAFGAAQACLDEAGLGDPFAPVPEGVDADAVWNECVAVAAAAVEDFLAAPPATSTP